MFNYKKIIVLILILLTISCVQKKYEKAVNDYLKYIKNNDLENAYNLLSASDKNAISLDDYISDSGENYIEIEISKRLKYKIMESDISETGKSAIVKVNIKKIYLPYLYNKFPELANPHISENDVNKIFIENKKFINDSYSENEIDYLLINENQKWVISADYGRKKHLTNLLEKAEKLFKLKKLEDSLSIYKKALEFDRYNVETIKNIEKIEERLHYIEKYIDFKYSKIINRNGKLSSEIEIRNNGTYMLKGIYAELVFTNNDDTIKKPIGELLEEKPLAYRESRKKTIKIDSVNNYNNILIRIYGIDF